MVKEIYIVCGTTGEYSDRREWFVAAYRNRVRAEQHIANLDTWLREHGYDRNTHRPYDYETKCPLDANFATDYTGTRYYVASCPYISR